MKRVGTLAVALLFRRLAKELAGVRESLAALVEIERSRLKLEAIRADIRLSDLAAAEEEEESGEPEVLMQADAELTTLDRLSAEYEKQFGHPPADEEDLLELVAGGRLSDPLAEPTKAKGERGEDRGSASADAAGIPRR